jgi:hypothetical protein
LGKQQNQQNRPSGGTLPPADDIPSSFGRFPSPEPACGGCVCFVPPAEKPGSDPVMLAASGGDRGTCLRFPQTVRKLPGEYCFEFTAKEPKPDAR